VLIDVLVFTAEAASYLAALQGGESCYLKPRMKPELSLGQLSKREAVYLGVARIVSFGALPSCSLLFSGREQKCMVCDI
jgi:hypothetical protein